MSSSDSCSGIYTSLLIFRWIGRLEFSYLFFFGLALLAIMLVGLNDFMQVYAVPYSGMPLLFDLC